MNNLKTFVLMAGPDGAVPAGRPAPRRLAGPVLAALVIGSALQLRDVLLLRPAGAPDVRGAGGHRGRRRRSCTRWWTGCASGPACRCRVVAVAPHEQPNAFATGRNPSHAVVAVTTGILKYVPQEELEGVIAHELAHMKNRDMLISTMAAGIAGALSNLPYLLLFGGAGTTRAGIRSPSSRWHAAGADRRDADPVRGLPAAGVRGRPGGRPDPGAAAAAGATRCGGWTRWRIRFRCRWRRPRRRWPRSIRWPPRWRVRQAVQHPPAHRGTRGAARSDGGGPLVFGHHGRGGLARLHRPGGRAAGARPGGAQSAVARALVQGGDELERRAHRLRRTVRPVHPVAGGRRSLRWSTTPAT